MVRTLDANLTNALNALSRVPSITVTCEDHLQHLSLYQNPGIVDAWNDCCIANDNSIIRCYVSRGGTGFNQTVYVQRITDPSNASQWATWTALGGAGTIFQDGGICICNNPDGMRIFAQRGVGGNDLYNWYSNNGGVSWAGPATVVVPPSSALTKGIGSAGNDDVFFLYDVVGGEAMGAAFYTGSWSSIHTWTLPTITGGAGVAVIYASSLYTIVYSDGSALYSATYNPSGGIWAARSLILPATSTAVGRISPRIAIVDGLYTVTVTESDNGVLTGTIYNYPRILQSADLVHWSTGYILHNFTEAYGCKLFQLVTPNSGSAGSRYYIVNPFYTFSSPMYAQDSAHYLDVSASVLSFKRTETAGKPAKLDLILDNNGGVLNNLVNTNSSAGGYPITPNGSIKLSEGYKTGTPPSTPGVVLTGVYHINQVVFVRSPEANALHIVAYDLSRNLDLVNRWQVTYLNQTLGWLITEICARAGFFSPSIPGTSQTSQIIPTFTLLAGQKFRQALNELCALYGLYYFLDQTEKLIFLELQPTDPYVWTYQPEIETVSFGTDDERANHIIVSAKPPVGGIPYALTEGEAYDDTNIALVQSERLLHYSDQKLTTSTQAALKAQFLLQQEQRAQSAHSVQVPSNPALQMYDPVRLVDSVAPVGSGQATNARIIGMMSSFEPEKAVFEMVLKLEGL